MNREEKEEEEDNPEEESIEESHKSPGSKTNRSDSLTFTPRANHRISRNNSQSSSLLNNRMSLVEATDTPRNLRNSTSGHPNNTSASNTLKRGGTLNRSSNNQRAPSNNAQKQPSHSSGGGRLMSKQSSTE